MIAFPPFSPPFRIGALGAAPLHTRWGFDYVPPPDHPVYTDSFTRHLNTALRAVTRSRSTVPPRRSYVSVCPKKPVYVWF